MAGLCGATLRVVNTFMVAICGTHMHTSMNSFLGIAPMFILAYVLNDPDCGYRTLVTESARAHSYILSTVLS